MDRYRVCATVAIIMALTLGANHASGAPNYVAVDLTPSGFSGAFGSGISGAQQVGYGGSVSTVYNHALLWTGSPQSYVDLHPGGLLVGSFPFTASHAYATSGTQQVGEGSIAQGDEPGSRALLWTGTAESCVNLNPSEFIGSVALATNGTQQVGWGAWRPTGSPPPGGPNHHAILWNGTATSFVDLNTLAESYATGISGSQQVGYGHGSSTNSKDHALLWSGTPSSCVDLNPSGFSASYAEGISGTQQVGYGVSEDGMYWYALLWYGSAATCVNLNPSGFSYSQAYATNGTEQVGFGMGPTTDYKHHALLWDGSADSYVDLHQFLPEGFTASEATAIDGYGNIVGSADGHAILWQPVPEPATLSLLAMGVLVMWRRLRW